MNEKIVLPDASSSGLAYVLLSVAFQAMAKAFWVADVGGARRVLDEITADLAIRVEEVAALRPADEARTILDDAHRSVQEILRSVRELDRGDCGTA